MMDASTDTGAVVTGLVETIVGNRASLVVTFSEPLDPASRRARRELHGEQRLRPGRHPGRLGVV